MSRDKLPARRHAINRDVPYNTGNGTIKIVVTVGYVQREGRFHVREVFCADFKAGTPIQSLAVDSCILLSRLIQHGDTPQDLLEHLCDPPSLIGTICKAICDEEALDAQEALSSGFSGKDTEHAGSTGSSPAPV